MDRETFFIERHSLKPGRGEKESKEYPGLTEKGVEAAREQIGSIEKIIEGAPKDALIFIGGASEMERTKSTAELRGEGLKEKYQGREDVHVLTKKEVREIIRDKKFVGRKLDAIADIIKKSKDKKVVIDYPLFVKAFSFGWRWYKTEDEYEYFDYLMEKHGTDEESAFREWLAAGQAEKDGKKLEGPSPEKVAQEYLAGLEKIKAFIKNHVNQDRPLIVGAVAHRFDLDAFILKATSGEVSLNSFEKILGGHLTDENESVSVEVKSGKGKIIFRGKEYTVEFKK